MYDPLVDKHTPLAQSHPHSYWLATTELPASAPALETTMQVDTLIIGAGLTGMSCAWYCQQQGRDTILIDANQPAWGCSGRNAGFILPGSGRLDFTGLQASYGNKVALHTIAQYYAALDTIAELLNITGESCELTSGGYLKIAHARKAFEQLYKGMQSLPKELQAQYQIVSPSELNQLLPDYPSCGGIYREQGQGLNPLKFSLSLLAQLETQQVKIFGDSPALEINKAAQKYNVITPRGNILAKNVVICSNAYSIPGLYKPVTDKQFPVLSSVLVSEPLPANETKQWQAGLMAMDTRSLKYYFRLLPDNRILFGGRGAITGKAANEAGSQRQLIQAFERYFPTLKSLRMDYFWSGWVSVSADNIPHVTQVEGENVFYATGYCGSGLSFSCHAGKLLAQKIAGKTLPDCAFDRSIPAFPFVPFRRMGLYFYYLWCRLFE